MFWPVEFLDNFVTNRTNVTCNDSDDVISKIKSNNPQESQHCPSSLLQECAFLIKVT